MTQTEFLSVIGGVKNSYSWTYKDNKLVGVAKYGQDKGRVYNPITALCRTLRAGSYPATVNGTLSAAKALGISEDLARAVVSQSNRGHAQIVRGKLLRALNV